MDRIILKDLLARGRIGITDKERERPQDILINIEMRTIYTKPEYRIIYWIVWIIVKSKAILSLVENNTRKTLEP